MFDKKKKIPIASDHAGFQMKEYLKEQLEKEGYEVDDHGTYSSDSMDYPDVIHPLARAINEGRYEMGIIMCGSGQGANMTANKYPRVRSALCWNEIQAKLSRQHNNANIVAIPARFMERSEAIKVIRVFLSTDFEGGRHERRVNKI